MFFLAVTVGLAPAFSHLDHVTMLVELCTCHIFAFNFAGVLCVRSPAPVADDVDVRLVVIVCSRRACLLYSLLLFVEHSTCRIHSCLPFVDFVLDFLHGVCLKLDKFLLQGVVSACSQCESNK